MPELTALSTNDIFESDHQKRTQISFDYRRPYTCLILYLFYIFLNEFSLLFLYIKETVIKNNLISLLLLCNNKDNINNNSNNGSEKYLSFRPIT